jgi:DNA-binding PadR family transcriptional regulator
MEKLSELGLADGPADPGAVYRALRTLEEDGFVTSEWKTQERGPARRVYHLTKLGEKLLEEWVKELKKRRDALDNIIALYEKADKEISD